MITIKVWLGAMALGAAAAPLLASATLATEGNAAKGERLFGTCAACHSLEPNRSMTGPSLSGLWNRKAGSLASFPRYSPALKSSNITWDDNTLDRWIADPQHLVPGNTMTFPGIKEAGQRADLLAFLKRATEGGQTAQMAPRMGGMMGGAVPNLKTIGADQRVKTIQVCRDTYRVTTEDGHTREFWERNLRFKTDSSEDGPNKGGPAIVDAGMMGDRADVIFASPDEISAAVADGC